MDGENFGERMARLKAERGTGTAPGPGRPKIAEKYRKQVDAVEKTFAAELPALAQEYLDELHPKDPERCPTHHRVLACPATDCNVRSQRTAYNHKAAAYALDRIMGRPTTRSENTVTVRLVQELATAFTTAFLETNDLPTALERRARFAARLGEIANAYSGSGGAWN